MKCARTVCDNQNAFCRRRDDGRMYCPACARTINEENNVTLIDFPPVMTVDGRKPVIEGIAVFFKSEFESQQSALAFIPVAPGDIYPIKPKLDKYAERYGFYRGSLVGIPMPIVPMLLSGNERC